ncbi:MAG: uroporphyrinogen-III synthase [Rhodobacteraceae bacterium]|nr:uroporphyrinogen-III synthase [Paracoccaceae bacterium]
MTRPKDQSEDFIRALKSSTGLEIDVVFSPMVVIEPIEAELDISDVDYLIFTSVNGVRQLAERTSLRSVPALCVGKTTAGAALAAGFDVTSADGTGEDLLRLALERNQLAPGRFLHVGGEDLAVDLANLLSAEGIRAQRLVLYRQTAVPLSKDAIHLLATKPVIVPLFSERAAQFFADQLENKKLFDLRILCISVAVTKPLSRIQAEITTAPNPPGRVKMIKALAGLLQIGSN